MTTPLPPYSPQEPQPGPAGPGGPPATPPTRPSFLRRNRLVLLIGTVVVIAGLGTGVALAANHGSNASDTAPGAVAASTAPPASGTGDPAITTPSGAPASGAAKAGHQGTQKTNAGKAKATRGVIVGESGSTWTVRTAKGANVTVTITAKTKFGTKKVPATRAQFTVGKPVTIVGTSSAAGLTAARVAVPMMIPAGTGGSTSAPTSPAPTTA